MLDLPTLCCFFELQDMGLKPIITTIKPPLHR